jgi:hypothetical protein
MLSLLVDSPEAMGRRDRNRPTARLQPPNHNSLDRVPFGLRGAWPCQGLIHRLQQPAGSSGLVNQRSGADRRAQVELIAARCQQNQGRAACLLQETIGRLPSGLQGQIQVKQHGRGLAGTHLPQRIGHSVHLHNGSPGSRCRTPQVLTQAGIIADQENSSLLRVG